MRAISASLILFVGLAGCMSITPQLHPTDIETLERIEDREQREAAYAANYIHRERDLRGTHYLKGERVGARPRSWQSLDAVLRSDRNSAAALPTRPIRVARVLTGLLATSAIVTVGGIAASAREGLDLSRVTGPGGILLGGGIATIGFGIGAGIAWGRARKGYDRAVDVYNDSLGLRLGLYDAEGEYRPPEGVLVDEEGFIILDQKELLVPGGQPARPQPIDPVPIEPQPIGPGPGTDVGPEGASEPAASGGDSMPEAPSASVVIPVSPAGAPHHRGLIGPARGFAGP